MQGVVSEEDAKRPGPKERRDHRDRSAMHPEQRSQVVTQLAAIDRAAIDAHRFKEEGLMKLRYQNEGGESERVRAILLSGQPARQKDADGEIRSGNHRLVSNRQTSF